MRNSGLPAGPRAPRIVQMLRMVSDPFRFLEGCARRYGDTFTIRNSFREPAVILTDPESVRQVFTASPEALYAGVTNAVMGSVLGPNSLLVMDGQRHLRERRLLMPPFHGERMQAYGEIICEATRESMRRWPRDRPINLSTELPAIALEVILRAVFGFSDGEALQRLRRLLGEVIASAKNPVLFVAANMLSTERIQRILERRAQRAARGQTGFGPWKRILEASAEVDRILYREIALRQAGSAEGRSDILSMLVQARDEDGNPMTEVELRDEMLTLLAAGHETTSTALAWAFDEILRDPAVAEKLVGELRQVIGDRPAWQADLRELPYLDATIKETLRLRPVVPIVFRKLMEPMTIGAHALPEGAVVAPCAYLAHRRAVSWPAPTRFRPERFLGARAVPYEYFPFGGSVRRCVGMAFALYEMRLVVAEVFSRARLRPHGAPARPAWRGLVLTPRADVFVRWG